AMRDARDGRDAFDLTCRLVLGGEDERWIAARGARVQEEGRPQRMTGTVVDISERVEIQTLALDAQRQFRLIFEMNPLPCWLFDRGTLRFLEVNPAAVRQYGYSREEFLRMRVTDIRPPAYLDDLDRALRQLETSPHGNLSLITVHRHRDGHLIDVQVHTARLEIAGIQALLVLAENVSEHMAYQRELAYRASHEPLTGLLTVPALCESLNCEQSGTRYTIAHVQLRGLQLISDTLGREIGKEVLRNLCRRLYALAERYGGLACQPAEDFVLVIDPQHDVDAVIAALGAALAEPVQGFDSFHQLDLRIGVAEYPGDGSSAEDVIAKAAQAAHAAREEGVGVVRFDESLERDPFIGDVRWQFLSQPGEETIPCVLGLGHCLGEVTATLFRWLDLPE
ncbi:PAS domain S-box protein, partial [Xanthomonas sp. Kuri4-2]